MDLHLHPVGEDGISVEVIDSAGVELGLLCSDGQILLGGTSNLAADRLKRKHRRWAASPPSSLVAEGTSRPLARAGKVEIPGFLPSSSHRDGGEGASPLYTPSHHPQKPSGCTHVLSPPPSSPLVPARSAHRAASPITASTAAWCRTQGHLCSHRYLVLTKPLVLQRRTPLGPAPQGEGISHGDGDGDRLLSDGNGCGETGRGDGNSPAAAAPGLAPTRWPGPPGPGAKEMWRSGSARLPAPRLLGAVSRGPAA